MLNLNKAVSTTTGLMLGLMATGLGMVNASFPDVNMPTGSAQPEASMSTDTKIAVGVGAGVVGCIVLGIFAVRHCLSKRAAANDPAQQPLNPSQQQRQVA